MTKNLESAINEVTDKNFDEFLKSLYPEDSSYGDWPWELEDFVRSVGKMYVGATDGSAAYDNELYTDLLSGEDSEGNSYEVDWELALSNTKDRFQRELTVALSSRSLSKIGEFKDLYKKAQKAGYKGDSDEFEKSLKSSRLLMDIAVNISQRYDG